MLPAVAVQEKCQCGRINVNFTAHKTIDSG